MVMLQKRDENCLVALTERVRESVPDMVQGLVRVFIYPYDP